MGRWGCSSTRAPRPSPPAGGTRTPRRPSPGWPAWVPPRPAGIDRSCLPRSAAAALPVAAGPDSLVRLRPRVPLPALCRPALLFYSLCSEQQSKCERRTVFGHGCEVYRWRDSEGGQTTAVGVVHTPAGLVQPPGAALPHLPAPARAPRRGSSSEGADGSSMGGVAASGACDQQVPGRCDMAALQQKESVLPGGARSRAAKPPAGDGLSQRLLLGLLLDHAAAAVEVRLQA